MSPKRIAALLSGLSAVFLAGLCGPLAVLEAQPRPQASELLQKVRSAYSSLRSFRDQGEIEAVHNVTGAIELHRFELNPWALPRLDLSGIRPSGALELLRKAGPSPGKWVLLFVQAGDEPLRTKGHLALLPQIDKLVSTLEPQDRVAVVSFDSRLRLRLDWSLDRADLLEALRSYRGEKAVVFLGFALGRRERVVTPAFRRAAEKLNSARASVFVLDVFQNENHELAAGLKTMAVSTGGTYASTYLFPSQAVKRLAQAISGYYVLTLDADELPWNGELLRIELRDKKKGTVVVRPAGSINTGGARQRLV